jgi:hypothetical protein
MIPERKTDKSLILYPNEPQHSNNCETGIKHVRFVVLTEMTMIIFFQDVLWWNVLPPSSLLKIGAARYSKKHRYHLRN